MGQFALPDMILREDRLTEDLAYLAAQVGLEQMPTPATNDDPNIIRLATIYDQDVEAAVANVYQRDYLTFGFGTWR
jgi:hypothetical protein